MEPARKAETNRPEIDRYLSLVEQRPELFIQTEKLVIVTDPDKMIACSERYDRAVGVVYESPWTMMLVDTVTDPATHKTFLYERVVPTSTGSPVVVIPYIESTESFVLLRQFRHSLRRVQLAFPRGYGEQGLSAVDNAEKELTEELNAKALSTTLLGTVCADSGLSGTVASVCLCRIDSFSPSGLEGIEDAIVVDRDMLSYMIDKGAIDDGFTLSAILLFLFHRAQP